MIYRRQACQITQLLIVVLRLNANFILVVGICWYLLPSYRNAFYRYRNVNLRGGTPTGGDGTAFWPVPAEFNHALLATRSTSMCRRYLRNMAMPMCVMLRLMVFHDLVMTKTSRSVSGTLMDSLSSVRLRRRPSSPVIVHWLGPRDAASLPIGRTCIELAMQPTVIPISTTILPQSSIRYVVLSELVVCQHNVANSNCLSQ